MAEMQKARLIPVSGIGSTAEAEQRATSALLAVISIVREFSETLFGPLGASKAKKALVECFTEIDIKLASGERVRPDGLVRVTYGSAVWSALIEVKTGEARLDAIQLNNYLSAAREVGAERVISISNEIGMAGSHPTTGLKVRSNSKVQIHHFSWTAILATAVRNKVHAGVADPEQAWILGELIRYLQHPNSGATSVESMGASWPVVRDGAREGTLKRSATEVAEIASKWDQLVRQIALHLSSETGADVTQYLAKSQQDPKARLGYLCSEVADTGTLSAEVRVPDTAGDMGIVGDLRARQISVHVSVPAPGDKKGRGSVSWLTRQLDSAPPDLVIEAYAKNARTPVVATLHEARQDPTSLLADGKSDIARFTLIRRSEAGQNGKSGGRKPGFIDSLISGVDRFYSDVLQHITPWVPPAPKVKRPPAMDTAPQPGPTQRIAVEPSPDSRTSEQPEHSTTQAGRIQSAVSSEGHFAVDSAHRVDWRATSS